MDSWRFAPDPDWKRLQWRAHQIVNRAVLSGELVKPPTCSKCRARGEDIHAHHENYDEPLNIVWLCSPCHREAHSTKHGNPAKTARDVAAGACPCGFIRCILFPEPTAKA